MNEDIETAVILVVKSVTQSTGIFSSKLGLCKLYDVMKV